MSIFRLLLLTSYFAMAFALLTHSPTIGLILTSLIPCALIIVYYPVTRKRARFFCVVALLLPLYLAMSGPALAVAALIRQHTLGNSMWGFGVHRALYPDVVFWNPEYLAGRRLIVYVHWWYELAAG